MGIAYNPRTITDGLVLCLDAGNPKSYPGSGTTWTDLSGNGYVGTLQNSPTYNVNNGGYFEFDGVDTAITTNLTRDNDNFSYSAWFRYGGGTGERDIIDTFEGTSTEWTRLNVLNGNHSFHIDNDNNKTVLQGSAAQTNVWYNSVGTWDPSTGSMKLYVNGELDAQTTKAQTTTISGLSNLFIGARSSSSYLEVFIGNIACVYVYSKTLTPQEIQQNYNALKSRFGL